MGQCLSVTEQGQNNRVAGSSSKGVRPVGSRLPLASEPEYINYDQFLRSDFMPSFHDSCGGLWSKSVLAKALTCQFCGRIWTAEELEDMDDPQEIRRENTQESNFSGTEQSGSFGESSSIDPCCVGIKQERMRYHVTHVVYRVFASLLKQSGFRLRQSPKELFDMSSRSSDVGTLSSLPTGWTYLKCNVHDLGEPGRKMCFAGCARDNHAGLLGLMGQQQGTFCIAGRMELFDEETFDFSLRRARIAYDPDTDTEVALVCLFTVEESSFKPDPSGSWMCYANDNVQAKLKPCGLVFRILAQGVGGQIPASVAKTLSDPLPLPRARERTLSQMPTF